MDNMSPQQQQQDSFSRGGGQQENKRRTKSQSYRRESAPSLVITKALTRSRTVSRDSFLIPVCPETCPLIQSFLACSGRSFLLHGHAQLKTGLQTQDRHLFLFNDILVIAKAKSANHFKQKAQACVCEMWTAGCMEEVCEGSTNLERSFVMGWPTCNCVATFSSGEQKEKWLSLLKSLIKEEKEREEPKTIPLKVHGKGINTFAVTKTLPVSNSDSTNEVVRLALQQFGIAGNVKDYQLWVISKRDNTPYPLIGHEFPFSIQMSHVRDLLCQGGSSRDAVLSPDRQRALQAEQLQADKQCQFILKPRPVATIQQHVPAESSQKPFKRRRSLINWAFWRGSSSHLNDSSLSLSGPAPGCLFGQPLGAVCLEETLPKPVMDMLVFLYHEGSWTRGIFRRPAGARAVRELRDALDGGEFQLPLTRDHVFIIAGVFKDFLRSIPGSLLCSEMYEEWMDVLEEEEEEEEQVQDIKRLIGRLPKENALLLRYLVAMLHGVQGNANDNLMTSFNLSVCIAHSMLWPPGPCSPEMEGEGAKKVCELVKFMIEHCQQLIGEDPSSLYGGPPQRPNTEEMGSDSWPYPLTDSSYDSLENELDDYSSSGSPAGRTRKGRLKPKQLQGSTDSIITLSDYDQDTDPDTLHTHDQTGNLKCLKLPQLGRPRGRRQGPDTVLSCPNQDAPTAGTLSTLDSLSLEGQQSRRRCSEPAIAYMTEFRPRLSGSAEGLTGDDEEDDEEELYTHAHTHSRGQSRRGGREFGLGPHGARWQALEASSSSLSSAATSPAPNRSSLDSLDSLDSLHSLHSLCDQTWQTRRGLCPAKAYLPSSTASSSLTVPSSSGSLSTSPSSPSTLGPAPAPGGGPDQGTCPPKEPLSWGTLKGSRGLHPNSWLKKARRLSLTQQDNLEKEEEDKTGGGSTDASLPLSKEKGVPGEKGGGKWISTEHPKAKPSCRATKERGGGVQARGRSGQEPAKPRPPKHDSSSPPSHHRSTGSLHYPKSPCFHPSDPLLAVRQLVDTHAKASQHHAHVASDITEQAAGSDVNELKQPPQAMFYKQSGPTLSLFKRQKSHSLCVEEERQARLCQRRASEPGQGLHRQNARRRLPSDPGLKVSEVDSQGGTSEPRFCLSPCATKAVREYFSSHPRSNPKSGQQVALALVESRREWLRRCSDPMAEPDFDQLLFAEESYV